MTQLTKAYHNSQRETITEDVIIDHLYLLQWSQFDAEMDAMERGFQGRTGTVNDLRCEGFSEKDLKWFLKTEEYLTEKLEALVKSEKLLKYSGYLSDFETVVEKYIPVELYEKDYFYFDHLYEERFNWVADDEDYQDPEDIAYENSILQHEELGIAHHEMLLKLKEREDS